MKLALPEVAVTKVEDDGSITYGDKANAPLLLVLGNDGYYMRIKTPIYECLVKMDKEQFDFPKLQESVQFSLPKLPEEQLNEAHEFLKESYIKNQSETVILYYYDQQTQTYEPFVPEQEVSSASIHYEISKEEAAAFRDRGLILVGTIHSHPGFSAFQSSPDEHDEFSIDGWHITIGDVTKRCPQYHARFCVGNKTFHTDIDKIVEFTSQTKKFPEKWLERVKKYIAPVTQTIGFQSQTTYWNAKEKGPRRKLDIDWDATPQSKRHKEMDTKTVRLEMFNKDEVKEHECTITF